MRTVGFLLAPKRIYVHAAADAVDTHGRGILPATIVAGPCRVTHAGAVLCHPPGFCVDAAAVELIVEVTGVGVHRKIAIARVTQLAEPGVHDAVVHGRVARVRVACPAPRFQVVIHRVLQVIRVHAGLAQQRCHVGAFGSGIAGILGVRIHVNTERNAQPLAFADVAQRLLVIPVAPTVADADNRTFDPGALRLGPVDIALPFRHVDHTLGLLHEQIAVGFEERRCTVVRSPIRAILIIRQRCQPYRRFAPSCFGG